MGSRRGRARVGLSLFREDPSWGLLPIVEKPSLALVLLDFSLPKESTFGSGGVTHIPENSPVKHTGPVGFSVPGVVQSSGFKFQNASITPERRPAPVGGQLPYPPPSPCHSRPHVLPRGGAWTFHTTGSRTSR